MEYFLIAKIEQVHGQDGSVRIKSFSDFPERYSELRTVYIDFWGDKKTFYVDDVKNVKGNIIIKFHNFDTTRDSKVLVGREVYVDDKNVVNLPENHFFIHEFIGCEVFVEKEKLGTVSDVIKGKANDVLVVLTDDNLEKLIPLVLNFIEKFDAAEKKLILAISKDFLKDDED